MADLPVEGRVFEEKKEVALTENQRLDSLTKDIRELARGVNVQGALLESIVVAFDTVLKKYLDLTRPPQQEPSPEENPNEQQAS